MRFAWSIFALAIVAVWVGAIFPDWAWLQAVAVPCGLVACLWLLLGGRKAKAPAVEVPRVVVDGSNVMYWAAGTPSLDPLVAVVREIEAKGMTPGVIFDANAGYKLQDRYLDDREFAVLLDLPEANVLVVPSGTPADRFILEAARSMDARIVTNDRFRDWADSFPEVRQPERLIKGSYRQGKLWLSDARPRAED